MSVRSHYVFLFQNAVYIISYMYLFPYSLSNLVFLIDFWELILIVVGGGVPKHMCPNPPVTSHPLVFWHEKNNFFHVHSSSCINRCKGDNSKDSFVKVTFIWTISHLNLILFAGWISDLDIVRSKKLLIYVWTDEIADWKEK